MGLRHSSLTSDPAFLYTRWPFAPLLLLSSSEIRALTSLKAVCLLKEQRPLDKGKTNKTPWFGPKRLPCGQIPGGEEEAEGHSGFWMASCRKPLLPPTLRGGRGGWGGEWVKQSTMMQPVKLISLNRCLHKSIISQF